MGFAFDTKTLQMITLFEQMTGAKVKDCIITEGGVTFIVDEGEIAKAIGKGGKNARELERMAKKKIKIAEFHKDLIQFIQNLIHPLELSEAKLDNEILLLHAKDLKTRGLLIGRNASNLRFFEAVTKRYFPIKEIKVA